MSAGSIPVWQISLWGEAQEESCLRFLAQHGEEIDRLTAQALESQTLSAGQGQVCVMVEDSPSGGVTVSIGGRDGFCADRRRTRSEEAALSWREKALDPNRSSSCYLQGLADWIERDVQEIVVAIRSRAEDAEREEAAW